MKYPVDIYAKALDQAFADPKADKARIGKNFLALVRKNGDEAHFGKILEEAARLAREREGIRKVTIESARPLAKSQEAMIKNLLKRGDVVEYEIDPDLVAGVRIVVNDERQFDGTMKAKLDALFSAQLS